MATSTNSSSSSTASANPDQAAQLNDEEFEEHDLPKYLKIAESAALQAGKFIRASLERRGRYGLTINDKTRAGSAAVDLVTEVDLQSEEIIIPSIRKAVSGSGRRHVFVGEESAFLTGTNELTDECTWFVDGIDGTTNFIHGYPFVTVSIGLLIKKQPVVGVVYNPFLDELYTAHHRGGAFLNGQRLQVSSASSIHHSMVATTLGSSRDRPYLNKLLFRLRALLLHKLQAFRVSGSTCQNLAHVASGRLDCYYDECGFGGPWDIAAGVVLVKEAGGILRGIDGGEFTFKMGQGDLVCGNAGIVEEVVGAIREADRKMWRKNVMVQLRGWGSIGVVVLSACAVSLFLGGKKSHP
ncbi:inositol monophosphatase [Nannochloropsis oceanica]